MRSVSFSVLALLALQSVSAHFFIEKLNGGTDSLRPIAANGQENQPVTGSAITTDDVACNTARPFSAYATSPVTVAAGSSVTLTWASHYGDTQPISGNHFGPCHVHIGKGLKPTGWTKIYETTPDTAGDWCFSLVAKNQNKYVFPIPAGLAPGQYVVRVVMVALHAAGQAGGAQFYPRCMDINVTGSGSSVPPFDLKIPGAFTGSTPGVLYDLYSVAGGGSGENGAAYVGKYPQWAGAVWTPSGNPVSPSPSPKTSPSPSPKTSPSPSPKTSPSPSPKTTTRTTTAISPSPQGPCKALLSQCGGSLYTGSTTCCTGTCQYKSDFYSQCV